MYYLVDPNDKVKAAYPDISGIATNGFRVVFVSDDVAIDPTDAQANPPVFEYDDLLRQKYEGLLALDSEFSYVLYDDLVDATAFDTGNSRSCGVGNGVYWVEASDASDGILRTVTLTLPGPITRAKLVWTAYQVTREDTAGFNFSYYAPEDPDTLTASISTDPLNPFVQVFNDESINLPAGEDIRIQFESSTLGARYYLGGFALLY